MVLISFARAVMMKYHRLGGIEKQKSILLQFLKLEAQD